LLKPNQFVNQFPNEHSLVIKHNLYATLEKFHGKVDFLPTTYNMETELAQFVGDFNLREENKEDNHWIVKPWNMGRSSDMVISKNKSCLIRQSETGPKVICKYIQDPILYEGRKFDLRFCVLMKSVVPLEIYVYNVFWTRLANEQFGLDHFENYQKHFTVMNYTPFHLTQLTYLDFIKGIEAQYPIKWQDVQTRIYDMLHKTFEAAAVDDPQYFFGHTTQSRALYAIDMMLDNGFQPKILEVNFSPDTTRACYDPHFYDKIFSVLFLNEGEGHPGAWETVTKI